MPSSAYYAPGLIRLEVNWKAFGRPSSNTWWFQLPHAPTMEDCFALAENWITFDSDVWAGFRSEDHELDHITCRSADRLSGAIYTRAGIGQGGAISNHVSPMLPAPQAVVAELLIPCSWPLRRRLYLSGITTGAVRFNADMTTLFDPYALGLEGALEDWRTFINGLGPGMLVAVRGYVDRTLLDPVQTCPVSGFHVNRHWTGTQVRRGAVRMEVH